MGKSDSSRRESWHHDKLRRLAAAWNIGISTANLAERFGVTKNTVINKLAKARKAGLPVADRSAKIVS